jgi:hypothetical protein
MKLKSLAGKKDLMKDSLVKDNYLISKDILSVSQLNSKPIVREKSGRERGYRSCMGHEAEDKIASVSFGISYLRGRA